MQEKKARGHFEMRPRAGFGRLGLEDNFFGQFLPQEYLEFGAGKRLKSFDCSQVPL
jgi:hypothetical protein